MWILDPMHLSTNSESKKLRFKRYELQLTGLGYIRRTRNIINANLQMYGEKSKSSQIQPL